MKKLLFYIFIITIIITTQSTILADGFTVGDEAIYYGTPNFRNIQKNITYRDIENSFAKDSIIKLTAFDIFQTGSKNFRPKSYVTREQASGCISRALGYYKSNPIETLTSLNILTEEDYADISTTDGKQRTATREEVALWLARCLGLEEKTPCIIRGFKDYSRFNINSIGLIESLLQEGLVVGYNNGYFRPNQSITKEQLAVMLDNTLDGILTSRGYSVKEGEIYDIKTNVTTNNHQPLIQRIYYMKNIDGTYPVIHTSLSSNGNLTNGFLLYKERKLSNSGALKIHDTIRYYVDSEGVVVFAEDVDIY